MMFDVLLSRWEKNFLIYFIVKIVFYCTAYVRRILPLFIRIIDPMEDKLLYVFKEKIRQGSIGPYNSEIYKCVKLPTLFLLIYFSHQSKCVLNFPNEENRTLQLCL